MEDTGKPLASAMQNPSSPTGRTVGQLLEARSILEQANIGLQATPENVVQVALILAINENSALARR